MGKVRPKDLENGVANLEANRYYGTNGSWELGFHLVPWASESTWEATFKFGENIAAGKLVFFWDGSFKERHRIGVDVFRQESMRAAVNLGNDGAHLRYRVRFDMPTNYEYLSNIVVPIVKVGTAHWANHWLQARIVTIAWDVVKTSNKPLGTQFVNGQIVFDFDNIKLTPGTSYWIEVWCNSTDWTNYFQLQLTSNSDYAEGSEIAKYWNYRYDGSAWVRDDNYRCICMDINFSIKTEQGSVYECNSDMIDTCVPDGIASETKSAWESWKVMVVWVSTAFDNLATGTKYKLDSDIEPGHRMSRADVRFWYNTWEQKIAQRFTCDFSKPISKMFLYLDCTNRTIANTFVAKIVEADETTGMPSENLVDANAIAKIPYADFVNNRWQPVVVKFPWEFSLTINKRYWIVLEIEWTLSTSGYMITRFDWSTGDGWLYRYETTTWNMYNNATSSLAYTFIHWDDVMKTMKRTMLWRDHWSYRRLLNIWETNSRKHAFRFMVSVPTRVKALTWCWFNNWTPITDLKIRIEWNKLLTNKANDNGLCYTGSWGSDFNQWFGSWVTKKVAMRFTPTEDQEVKMLSLWLQKTSAPTEKITVRIETDNEEKPSGTLVDEKATATSDQSMAAHTNRYVAAFQFDKNISLTKNTTYWLVVSKENEEVSSTAYYQWYCKNNWTFTGWELWRFGNNEWSKVDTGNVKALFCFNNSYNESMDVPSGNLVSEWAIATFPSTSHLDNENFFTANFNQEVSLIPNTIYWLVFDNFRPITDNNYYRIQTCESWNWLNNNRDMWCAYLSLYLSEQMKWQTNDQWYYPRFFFDSIRDDNGWTIDVLAWEYAGKDVTAISDRAGMLWTGEAGIVFKKSLYTNANTWDSKFVFRAPRDGQITFLKDLAWTVRAYNYWNNYTPYSTQTWEKAGSVNIEKGKLYQIENGTTSQQDFIISLK